MANVLSVPLSGNIYFHCGGQSCVVPDLTESAVSLGYDGCAGVKVTSFNTAASATDRFTVAGGGGSLFSVNDTLTGTVFSVNDAAGLPIIEVNSDTVTDTIAIGEYGTNALFVSAGNVGIGTVTPTSPLDVVGNISTTGNIISAGVNIDQLFGSGGGGGGASSIGGLSDAFVSSSADSIGLGTQALDNTQNLKFNIGLGYRALRNVTSGTNNIGIGNEPLNTLTTGNCNIGIGFSLGKLTTASHNLAIGYGTLKDSTTGWQNIALGNCALYLHTTGSRNVAVGYRALCKNTTGMINTAIGDQALACLTTASQNTAVGGCALMKTTTGGASVAVGNNVLCNTTTGGQNVAIGYQAMAQNITGCRNVAIGLEAMWYNTGDCNTALGHNALRANTSGIRNTVIGFQSLYSNTTGMNNVAVGNSAGRYITGNGANQTSGTSVYIGGYTKACADGGANETVIGYDALGKGSNTVTLGNSSVTVVCSNGTFSTVSDIRDKTCICDLEYGLSFIGELKPKTFNMITDRNDPGGSISCKRHGFIAQEILELEGDDPVIIRDDNPDQLGFTGEHIIPILVKGMQEQQTIIDNLTARLEALEG